MVLLLLVVLIVALLISFRREIALARERRRKNKYLKLTRLVRAGDIETRVYIGESYAPPIPSKEGYIFKGWFVDTALTTPRKSTDRVECDLVLYPKWEKA